MKKVLAYIVAAAMAVVSVGAIIPVQADAAVSPADRIYREGKATKNMKVNKYLELEVEKGNRVKDSDLWWSVSSGTKVVKITSSDRSDEDVTIKGLKAGTAKVKVKNKRTGGSIVYTIKVSKSSGSSTNPANRIYKEGNLTKNMKVNKVMELEVEKGRNVKDSNLWWSVSSGTAVVKITSSDKSDDDITIKALKAGTAKVKCKNNITGGSIIYTVKVTELGKYNIVRVGSATRTVELGDDAELKVTKGDGLQQEDLQWSIEDSSVLRFDEGNSIGTEVEVVGLKLGSTKVSVKNLHTGGQLIYTVKVVPEYDD